MSQSQTDIQNSKRKVLFILHGSIAAYKVCSVISKLAQAGHQVRVVASAAALKFIGKATLEGLSGQSVWTDLYEDGQMMAHIHLVRWADVIVSAPATANAINKMAQGLADDLPSTLFLAHDFQKPWILAPAMNVAMFEHPITQASFQKLQQLGLILAESPAGALACGEVGKGRLVEPDELIGLINKTLEKLPSLSPENSDSNALKGKPLKAHKPLRILVTAGGTVDNIDDVRTITNISTGKTGIALAEGFSDLGFEVVLMKSAASPESRVQNQKTFTDFKSLETLLKESLKTNSFDMIVHAAAVSDYSVSDVRHKGKSIIGKNKKISSEFKTISIELVRNPKLISHFSKWNKSKKIPAIVAFKLLSGADSKQIKKSVEKLFADKYVSYVVSNDWQDYRIGKRVFQFWDRDGETTKAEGVQELLSQLALRVGAR